MHIKEGIDIMEENIYKEYEVSGKETAGTPGVLKLKKDEIVKDKSQQPKTSQTTQDISHSETNFNKASFFYQNNSFASAERLLLESLEFGTDDARTFDMLISIYRKTGDYQKLIKTVDAAAKHCTGKKNEYKQLKKSFILEQIIKDMNEG